MTRLRMLASLLAAMSALGAVAAVGVLAVENPEILSTLPSNFTFKGGLWKLNTSEFTLECQTATGTGEFASVRLGNVMVGLLSCKTSGVSCKTPGDALGTILFAAGIHLVGYKNASNLALGLAMTPTSTVSSSCGTLIVQFKETAIGHIDDIESGHEYPPGIVKTLLFNGAGGKQEVRTCEVDTAFCLGKTYEMLGSISGEFRSAIEKSTNELKFATTIKINY